MKLAIKAWKYNEIKEQMSKYHRVPIAEQHLYDTDVYILEIEDIITETPNAVQVDCKYFRTSSGDYIDVNQYSGHRVCIPKSAIIR